MQLCNGNHHENSEKPCIRKSKKLANESSETKANVAPNISVKEAVREQCLLFQLGSNGRMSTSPYFVPFFFLFPKRKRGNTSGKRK